MSGFGSLFPFFDSKPPGAKRVITNPRSHVSNCERCFSPAVIVYDDAYECKNGHQWYKKGGMVVDEDRR